MTLQCLKREHLNYCFYTQAYKCLTILTKQLMSSRFVMFYFLFLRNYVNLYRMSQNIVPNLCGCCGGALSFVIPYSAKLHRIGFVLEFVTLFESISQLVVNLWQMKGKNVVASKRHCIQNQVVFETKGSGVVFKFSLYL